MKLIVGLGNPGKQYEKTRHNMGFMIIDCFLEKYNTTTLKEKFKGIFAEANIKGEKVLLLKPQSYMNLSGEVILEFVRFYKIKIEDILIISDDIEQEVGKVRLRTHGSSGGHNGLKNIEQHLKTQEYKRLRVGIGKNKMIETADYVLGKFSKEEEEIIKNNMEKYTQILEDFVTISFAQLMSRYNSNK